MNTELSRKEAQRVSSRVTGLIRRHAKAMVSKTIGACYRAMGYQRGYSGVTSVKREVPLIVSMTTIPARFHLAPIAIQSVLRQSLKPDHLFLWYDETQGNDSPAMRRCIRQGLVVRPCRDVGPHTKLVHCLAEYPQAVIVTADDDYIYPRTWLERLYASYLERPDVIHCHCALLMSFDAQGMPTRYKGWQPPRGCEGECRLDVFPLGYAGVLYPPGALSAEALDLTRLRELAPFNDDIWFKGMSLLKGTPCRQVDGRPIRLIQVEAAQQTRLGSVNLGQGKNNSQLRDVFTAYGLRGGGGVGRKEAQESQKGGT